MKRRHVSHGRSRKARGLDQFDTPIEALGPLFVHEPLLANVRSVCEPFCGIGNLVVAMRKRGLTVHASDIEDRGCPGSTVLDFRQMTTRPAACDVLLSNPPFNGAMDHIEHAWRLGFRLLVLLLSPNFMHTTERFERLHKTGRLRRVFPLSERLQGMHDAAHVAAGGKLGSQPQTHIWLTLDAGYCGPATIVPISIQRPTECMPWAHEHNAQCIQCRKSYVPSRADAKFCSAACRQRAWRERESRNGAVTPLDAVRGAQ